MKTALIFGVSGQDGAYLSHFLLGKGYRVIGTSRNHIDNAFKNLKSIAILDNIELLSVNPLDYEDVKNTILNLKPDEIYFLCGQSSVSKSFEVPIETFNSIAISTLNLLEAVRHCSSESKVFNPSSSECFGGGDVAKDENSPFYPASPYGVAKASAHMVTENYRSAFDLYCCSGILFNHESPLRPEYFVTQKIISSALSISRGEQEFLSVGNIEIKRDWGWAPDYVTAMWLMLQHSNPDDFVIASGKAHSLKSFLRIAFAEVGLDWKEHVRIDPAYMRPKDILISVGNPSKINKVLGWEAQHSFEEMVREMMASAIATEDRTRKFNTS